MKLKINKKKKLQTPIIFLPQFLEKKFACKLIRFHRIIVELKKVVLSYTNKIMI